MTPYSVGNHIQILSLKQTCIHVHVYWYTVYLPFVLYMYLITFVYAHVSVYFSLTTSVVRVLCTQSLHSLRSMAECKHAISLSKACILHARGYLMQCQEFSALALPRHGIIVPNG